jgi:predicted cation transporter
MVLALGLILLAVLLGPVVIKPVERNIEVFFLVVGALAAALSGQWSWPPLHAAVTEPIALTIAVLVFGAIARLIGPTFDRWIERLLGVMSAHWIYFILIVALGLLSSVITAVIAALILVEAISLLNLDR